MASCITHVRVVLPPGEDFRDAETFGKLAPVRRHPAQGDVIPSSTRRARRIDHRHLADRRKLLKQVGHGEVNARAGRGEAGKPGKQQRKHAVEAMHAQLPIGPVIGRLPVQEVDVLHVLERILDGAEAAIRGDDIGGGPVQMVADQQRSA